MVSQYRKPPIFMLQKSAENLQKPACLRACLAPVGLGFWAILDCGIEYSRSRAYVFACVGVIVFIHVCVVCVGFWKLHFCLFF